MTKESGLSVGQLAGVIVGLAGVLLLVVVASVVCVVVKASSTSKDSQVVLTQLAKLFCA